MLKTLMLRRDIDRKKKELEEMRSKDADFETREKELESAIDETEKRRKIQIQYNEKHGIIPKTIQKKVFDVIDIGMKDDDNTKGKTKKIPKKDYAKAIEELTAEMKECAKRLDFERAAYLRDLIINMQKESKKK